MKSYKELSVERIKIRSENPERASVLSLLLDAASKAAKEEKREPTQADLMTAAKKAVKEIDGIETMMAQKVSDGSGDALLAKYRAERAIYQEFLPEGLPAAAVEAYVNQLLNSWPEEDRVKKNFGKAMAALKGIDGMDGAILSKVLQSRLK